MTQRWPSCIAGDPSLALDVINGILEDGDQAELLTVLRQLAQAFGGVQGRGES